MNIEEGPGEAVNIEDQSVAAASDSVKSPMSSAGRSGASPSSAAVSPRGTLLIKKTAYMKMGNKVHASKMSVESHELSSQNSQRPQILNHTLTARGTSHIIIENEDKQDERRSPIGQCLNDDIMDI